MVCHQPALVSTSVSSRCRPPWRRTILCVVFPLFSLLTSCQEGIQTAASSKNLRSSLQTWQLERNLEVTNSTTALINLTRAFIENPDTDLQKELQEAWIKSHNAWQSAALLLEPELSALDNIDAWPMAPGYLDSLADYPGSGIVNDIALDISAETLRDQHQYTDDTEIALGFHVIEYYAFARELSSFLPSEVHADRRLALLSTASDLLLLDMLTFSRNFQQNTDFGNLPQSYPSLIKRLHRRSMLIFSELNRLGDHSRFSQTSLTSLTTQLKTLRKLMTEPPTLNRHLIDLDPEKAEVVNETLNEVIGLLDDQMILREADEARSLLLVSALRHQLEELARLSAVKANRP